MATAYVLEHFADEKLKATYLPHVISTGEVELYEGATFLTERQGGSDVGANAVRAVPCGDHYKLYGEKIVLPAMPAAAAWRLYWRASTGAGRGRKG